MQIITGWLILTSCNTYGQQPEDRSGNKWVFNLGALINSNRVIDEKFSAIPFTGSTPGGSISVTQFIRRKRKEVYVLYSNGNQSASVAKDSRLSQSSILAGYRYLLPLRKSAHTDWTYRAGGSIDVWYARRSYKDFINTNVSYEFISSLQAVAEIGFFNPEKLAGLHISDIVTIPFLSLLQQPAFGRQGTEEAPLQDGWKAGSRLNSYAIVSFSSFARISNYLEVKKDISRVSAIGIGYNRDYYRINEKGKVTSASNRFSLLFSHAL